jgi:hypothetical protein
MRKRNEKIDRCCLDEAFQERALHGRQCDLIVVASLFATGWVLPSDRRLVEAYVLPILDALDLAQEAFIDEIMASVALSEAEL